MVENNLEKRLENSDWKKDVLLGLIPLYGAIDFFTRQIPRKNLPEDLKEYQRTLLGTLALGVYHGIWWHILYDKLGTLF